MVEVGSSILFSFPVMKIILYNRQLSDGDFLYGNSHRGKKEKNFFQTACECLIRLRLQTNGKKTYCTVVHKYSNNTFIMLVGKKKLMLGIIVHKTVILKFLKSKVFSQYRWRWNATPTSHLVPPSSWSHPLLVSEPTLMPKEPMVSAETIDHRITVMLLFIMHKASHSPEAISKRSISSYQIAPSPLVPDHFQMWAD